MRQVSIFFLVFLIPMFPYCQQIQEIWQSLPVDSIEKVDSETFINLRTPLGDRPSESRRFQVLLLGKLSLFVQEKPRGQKLFFVKTFDDPRFHILAADGGGKQTYRGTLKFLTAECPKLADAIEKGTLQANSIISVLEKFHDCINAEYETFLYRSTTKLLLSFGPEIGFHYMQLREENSEGNAADWHSSLSWGGFLRLNWGGKFYLQPSFRLLQRYGELESANTLYDFISSHQYTYLEVPIQLGWRFKSERLHPTIFLGAIIGFPIRGEYRAQRFFGGTFNREVVMSSDQGMPTRNEFGFRVGGGLDFNLRSGKGPFVQLAFERTQAILQLDDEILTRNFATFYYNVLAVTGGYRF